MSEDAAAAAETSAGALLRAARERQGMHLAVLAASLKVTPRKLELLEANRYDELPDATFVRALALSVCRALKIDAEPVLQRLPQPRGHGLEQVARGLNQPYRERDGGFEGSGEWRRRLSLPVIGAGLLVLAAALVYWVPTERWPVLALGSGSAPVAPAASAAAPPPAVAPEPVAVASGLVAASESAALAVSASAPAPAASAVVETVFSAPDDGASAPVAGGLLTLRATAESWIEVRDRNGQLLLSRTLAAGESAGLDGALPLRLTIGNADATQVVFRGQPVVLAASTRDNVARLELK